MQRVIGFAGRWGRPAARGGLLFVLAACPASPLFAAPAEPPALVRVRQLYNQGQYAAAIEAAQDIRTLQSVRDVADLLIGRARLELHRASGAAEDLAAAREALRGVRATSLNPRDQVELIVGLGEGLFFENAFLAAATLFETALVQSPLLGADARERLFDWWASALDREAQARPPEDRGWIYGRVIDETQYELRRDPGSATASYWLAAALRASGEPDDAWHAVLSAWVLATFNPRHGTTLRADLDRLMREAIVPERARRLAGPEAIDPAAETLLAEWEKFKAEWQAKQ